jgi:hypothetical protein
VQGENLNSTAAQQRDFSFQAAISQFSGSIDVIDLAGNRCLVPSSSVTPAHAGKYHIPQPEQPGMLSLCFRPPRVALLGPVVRE